MDSFIDSQGPSSCSWFSSELTLLALETYSILKAFLSNNTPPPIKRPQNISMQLSALPYIIICLCFYDLFTTLSSNALFWASALYLKMKRLDLDNVLFLFTSILCWKHQKQIGFFNYNLFRQCILRFLLFVTKGVSALLGKGVQKAIH